jgi:hypothetical protein
MGAYPVSGEFGTVRAKAEATREVRSPASIVQSSLVQRAE